MALGATAVAATLPARDPARAKRFFLERLGLTPPSETDEDMHYTLASGSSFLVLRSTGEPSGTHTQAGFEVQDIRQEVAELRVNGVVFEEYDMPGFTSVDGVVDLGHELGAWLKDSEGNLLGIFQPIRP